MTVEIEITPNETGKRVVIVKYVGGKPEGVGERIDPLSRNSRVRVARQMGVDEPTLSQWLAAGKGRYALTDAEPEPGLFVVRPIEGNAEADGTPYAGWLQALAACPAEGYVLVWTDRRQLCCLDVDYHDPKYPAPDKSWLEGMVVSRIVPRPRCWHFSRSGGLHLFYERSGEYAADELAAVAALRYRQLDPTAGVELKKQVRGAGSLDKLFATQSQDTTGLLSQWLGVGNYDPADVDDWLHRNGLERDKRYNHDRCPIEPTPDDGGSREPVQVLDGGVYCHRCAGKGLTVGGRVRKPGFVPWAVLVGSPAGGDVGNMVRNLCHWGHARWLLAEKYGLPEGLARLAYSAACRSYHAGKPTEGLIPGLFHKDTAAMARVNNQWMDLEQSYVYEREGLKPILCELPACQVVDVDKGVIKSVPSTVAELSQGKDLTDRGYPSLEVIHGFRFSSVYLPPPDDKTFVPVLAPAIRNAAGKLKPRYDKSMTEEEGWRELEQIMPGLDRPLVKTVLCALGCAQETRMGMHPFVFVTGPAGAAKTTTVKVGAAIAGVPTGEPLYDADTTRFRAGIAEAARETGVVLINEILKDAERGNGRGRQTPRQALDPILNLTPNTSSHLLYRGPVKLGRVPAVFFTEPTLPLNIRDETQIARRLRHRALFGRKDEWMRTMPPAGITPDTMDRLRLVSPAVASACNAILAAVVDEFFAEPMPFDAMAVKLGVHTVEQSEEFEDMTPYLRELFRQVCLAPDLQHEWMRKRYANGYKRIARSDGGGEEHDRLVSLYSMFADGPGPEWTASRRLLEKDWSGVLKTHEPVWLDLKTDGSSVFIRFRVGPLKTPAAVNERIVGGIDAVKAWETGV